MRVEARRSATAALLLLVLLAAAACAGSGRSRTSPQRQPEPVLSSPVADEQVGRKQAELIGAQLGLVEDPELTAYVDAIGQRLARHVPRGNFDYRFQIVDQDAPNAFALPGGYIYVSRGLLVLANSEDELACVIGHEVVHVAARHASARQSMLQGVIGPMTWFQAARIASYSREQEREADRHGQGLSGAAGFDPQGMATFLRDLDYSERLRSGSSRLPSFLDTHPGTAERAAAAGARAQTIAWTRAPRLAANRAAYLRRIEGLTVGTSAAEGVFQGNRFVHPELDFSMRFPDRWEVINTRQAVGAVSPARNGQVFLEFHGPGNDPERAAQDFLGVIERQGFRLDGAQAVSLGEHDAYRLEGRVGSPMGPLHVVVSFIARGGVIYRLTGLGTTNSLQAIYVNAARSFREAAPYELERIHETRLRLATALEGETLAALGERTGNRWDLQQTAVWNDLFANEPLSGGELIKIAVSEPYEPARTRR